MKKTKNLCFLIFAVTFINCASLPTKETHPFTITKATYQNWTGGVKVVNELRITINFTSEKEIDFQKLFYKGKQKKVSLKKDLNGEKALFVKFNNVNKKIIDLQLHGDSKKEFGNKPSKKEPEFPFDLKDNEAVLSYKQNDVIKYFKIENIEKEKRVIHQ